MCINEPDITKVLILSLQKEFGQKYDLSIAESCYIDTFLAQAESEAVDLFILLLNNMIHSPDFKFCGDKNRNPVERQFDIITHLKHTYQKPVIAMTGWPLSADSWNEENTKRAGASVLLQLPVEGSLLRNAVRQCLEHTAPARCS
jgi:hypothetical protein